jgi:hypothetical protein
MDVRRALVVGVIASDARLGSVEALVSDGD